MKEYNNAIKNNWSNLSKLKSLTFKEIKENNDLNDHSKLWLTIYYRYDLDIALDHSHVSSNNDDVVMMHFLVHHIMDTSM